MSERLPVHGFVLAGGKSSRMGQDKALLQFRGRPMVEIAVEKLRSFCAAVSIVGEREDLAEYAPPVRGERAEAGPAAGIEAGLRTGFQPWAMFMPVDVPLLPGEFLRVWAEAVLAREDEGVRLSFLVAGDEMQPAICLIHRDCQGSVERALDEGLRKLTDLFEHVQGDLKQGTVWPAEAGALAPAPDVEVWFSNVNTPAELEAAQQAATRMKY